MPRMAQLNPNEDLAMTTLNLITVEDVLNAIPPAAQVAVGRKIIATLYDRATTALEEVNTECQTALELGNPILDVALVFDKNVKAIQKEVDHLLSIDSLIEPKEKQWAFDVSYPYYMRLAHNNIYSKLDVAQIPATVVAAITNVVEGRIGQGTDYPYFHSIPGLMSLLEDINRQPVAA